MMMTEQDLFNQFVNSPDEESRYPFLQDGVHDLVVAKYDEYTSKASGFTIRAEFLVIASTNPAHPAGSFATKLWQPTKTVENFPDFGKRESARARKFVGTMMHGQALNGVTVDGGNPEQTTQVVWYLLKNKDAQPARGIAVRCHGTTSTPAAGATTKSGKAKRAFTDHNWENIPNQTPQTIAGYRAQVERALGAAAPVAPGPHAVTQPQYAPQTAPTGFGQAPAAPAQPAGFGGFGQAPAAPAPAPTQPAPAPAPGAIANLFGSGGPKPGGSGFGGAF